MELKERVATHKTISAELASLSNEDLMKLLQNATSLGTTMGGTTAVIHISNTPIFVKKIRLTDIEQQPENKMSTANVFNLPVYYQYGIGSAGFGAWRELSAHTITTNWVIMGECPNFPILYHWRELPSNSIEHTDEVLQKLEEDVKSWGGNPAIRERIEANQKASAEIILFLEHFPENVNQWLAKELRKSNEEASAACMMVEHNLYTVIPFINERGLLHFDAHFWNILTDGKQLYFSDFGLAISKQFNLSQEEIAFYNQHKHYDQYYIEAHLT